MSVTLRPLILRQAALALFATTFLSQAATAGTPEVVTSIAPVHSITARIMAGIGAPSLLLSGSASPHGFSLKPSQMRALSKADLIIYAADEIETFMAKSLSAVEGDAKVVNLSKTDGISVLSIRDQTLWGPQAGHEDHQGHGHDEEKDAHDDHKEHGHGKEKDAHDDHEEHGHDEKKDVHEDHQENESHDDHAHGVGSVDGHLWLNPKNGQAIATVVTASLSAVDPANAATYRQNLTAFTAELTALDRELADTLKPVGNEPYVVFHDAYQYFEKHYDLAGAGTLMISPERAPSARALSELRDHMAKAHVQCVFSEPQFRPNAVKTLAQDLNLKTGVLDPIGAQLTPGPTLYETLLRNMANNLHDCLAGHRP